MLLIGSHNFSFFFICTCTCLFSKWDINERYSDFKGNLSARVFFLQAHNDMVLYSENHIRYKQMYDKPYPPKIK